MAPNDVQAQGHSVSWVKLKSPSPLDIDIVKNHLISQSNSGSFIVPTRREQVRFKMKI